MNTFFSSLADLWRQMLAESSRRSYKVRITHSGDTRSTEKTLNSYKTVELTSPRGSDAEGKSRLRGRLLLSNFRQRAEPATGVLACDERAASPN